MLHLTDLFTYIAEKDALGNLQSLNSQWRLLCTDVMLTSKAFC